MRPLTSRAVVSRSPTAASATRTASTVAAPAPMRSATAIARRQRPSPTTTTTATTLTTTSSRSRPTRLAASTQEEEAATTTTTTTEESSSSSSSSSASSSSSSSSSKFTFIDNDKLPLGKPTFVEQSPGAKGATKFRLAFALPWRRFKSDSALVIDVSGSISEKRFGRFAPTALSMPQLCRALEKAAYDPRVSCVYLRIDAPVAAGWAKLQEICDYIELFNQSGKPSIAFMSRASEKEYYLASACTKIFIPPSASLSLRGVGVAGTFLRGIFEKIGVTPEIRRIGEYKSAGDQLLRKTMSPFQREQLEGIVDAVYDHFTSSIAERRGGGRTKKDAEEMLDAGIFDNEEFLRGGWVDGLMYEDEVVNDVVRPACGLEPQSRPELPPPGAAPKPKPERTLASFFTGGGSGNDGGGENDSNKKPSKKALEPLRTVDLKKYSFVSPTAFGLVTSRKRIAVVRATGAIVGGSSAADGQITAAPLCKLLEALGKDARICAVVLRVDSPGGDALASDLVWRSVRSLASKKPVVASMGDVAASGGYYIPMAASKIVAQPLTITGSIGVVTGKLVLGGGDDENDNEASLSSASASTSASSAAAPMGGFSSLFGGVASNNSSNTQQQEGANSSNGKNGNNGPSLYSRVGYNKTLVTRGKFGELLTESRPFRADEAALFDASARHAYESFRDKAADSRGKSSEDMEKFAQGRVWVGSEAAKEEAGLVDALGGLSRAVAIASALAGVPEGERAGVIEVSRATTSPLSLLTGGGGASASSSFALSLFDIVAALFRVVAAAASGSNGAIVASLAELGGLLSAGGAGAGSGAGGAAASPSSSTRSAVTTALALSDPSKPLALMLDEVDVGGSSQL